MSATGLATFIRRRLNFEERLAAEGYPQSAIVSFNGTAANNTGAGTLTLPGLTRAFWVENAIITSNKNLIVQIAMTASAIGGSGYTYYVEQIVGPNCPVIIPIRRLLRPAAYTSGSIGAVTIKQLIDADGTTCYLRTQLLGVKLTDDINYTADKTMLWLGDSITGDGTGITQKYNQYDWRLRKYLRDAGINVRMVNLSVSGTTSQDFDKLRQHGMWDLGQVDLLCYSLGMNDAANSLSAATFQANVAAAILWKQQRYPNAKMLVFGGTPAENNTTETNAATMRTNAAAAVTAAADPNVVYINLGAAFDRTAGTTVYASTDSAGSRIHPNDTGHTSIWTVIQTYLDANPSFRP